MRRRRRRNNFKFTEKTNSKRGMASCSVAAACIAAMVFMVCSSFEKGGNGSVYLGSAGVLALVFSVGAFVEALKSLKEENSFKTFPIAATILSLTAAGGWSALYVAGFLI